MGLTEYIRVAFCCWRRGGCCIDPLPEKAPLVSNNNSYPSYVLGGALTCDDERNLWNSPGDLSHTEADDDRILHNLLVARNQLQKDTVEWEKINYDICAIRQIRREVKKRWKQILEDLGFQKEVNSLLSVTKLSTINDSQNMKRAQEMLLKLAEETYIFPDGWGLPERYLFVLDRLFTLDAVEDFFKIASKKYPK
ncbi:melanoregulin [Rhinatrema bivittatum]|uniref:melanoregulin n=1 Tax=Rhinatrema bivittatum TaxID=194408 RepID=UPI00112ED3BF|nr:melanoregulin [Rhinatrema bivittatum]